MKNIIFLLLGTLDCAHPPRFSFHLSLHSGSSLLILPFPTPSYLVTTTLSSAFTCFFAFNLVYSFILLLLVFYILHMNEIIHCLSLPDLLFSKPN